MDAPPQQMISYCTAWRKDLSPGVGKWICMHVCRRVASQTRLAAFMAATAQRMISYCTAWLKDLSLGVGRSKWISVHMCRRVAS